MNPSSNRHRTVGKMAKNPVSHFRWASAIILGCVASLVAAGGVAAAGGVVPALDVNIPACPAVPAGIVRCDTIVHHGPSTLGQSSATSNAPYGFSAQQLEAAYAMPVGEASSQTIAIVDPYYNPDVTTDLATYRTEYGLPPCSYSNGCFEQYNQSGASNRSDQSRVPTNAAWGEEEATDLEMASAACPECRLWLFDAQAATMPDVFVAIHTAVSRGATEVSLSFGSSEFATETQLDSVFDTTSTVFAVAGGDGGYSAGVQYPAASPYVIAVGGTSLQTATTARGYSETAWSGNQGGCSQYERKPSWQVSLGSQDGSCSRRTVMDAAADGNPNTGVAVYDSYGLGGWAVVGGTSVSTPLIAGFMADKGGAHGMVGAQALYQLGATTDITSGGTSGGCAPAPSYYCTAQVGYDGPTGEGSPLWPQATLNALPSTEPTSSFSVSWTPVAGQETTVWYQDGSGDPWSKWTTTNQSSTTFVGDPGATYSLAVQAGTGDYFGGSALAGAGSTTVSAGATPPSTVEAVSTEGTILPAGSAPLSTTALWNYPIIKGIALTANGEGGDVVDAYGGVHAIGDSPPATGVTGYWSGNPIVRGIVVCPNGTSGYVLDAWGGLHPFGGAPAVEVTGYWPGRDVAVAVALNPAGTGGYVLDEYGGLHPFGVTGAVPPMMAQSFYWNGYNIARGLVLTNNGTGAYVVDGWGNLHSAGTATPETDTAQWPGQDQARGVVLVPGSSTSGYVVDTWGNVHSFGGAPYLTTPMASSLQDAVGVAS